MSECPKCGGDKIIGPKFVSAYGVEHLRYDCFQCGYWRHEKTIEQKRREAPLAAGAVDPQATDTRKLPSAR